MAQGADRSFMRPVALICLLALVAVTSSCGRDGSAAVRLSEPTVRVLTAQDIVLPLDRYDISPGDAAVVQRARAALNAACATRFGSMSTEPEPDATVPDPDERRYGILDPDAAARLGYRTEPIGVQERGSAVAVPDWRPGALEALVMTGAYGDATTVPDELRPVDALGATLPAGGCFADTQRRLELGVAGPVNPQYLPSLQARSYEEAEADAHVRTAWRSWSACMRERGYAYDTPWQPNDQDWGEAVSDRERATALIDVQCRRSTRMTDIWMATEVAYQHRIVNEEESRLQHLSSYNATIIRNARLALGES